MALSVGQIAVDILLGIGVLSALLCCVALLVMKDLYERLHYLSPPSSLSVMCFAAAVLIDKKLTQSGIKALIIMVVLLVMNSVLTHATARAARVRQFKEWEPDVSKVRPRGDKSTAGVNSRPLIDQKEK
jgi:monovalent cation/proton antiporter MnhG/PhaG subunit